MKTQTLEYSLGDKTFIGYLVWDDSLETPRPGVLVFPEAFGLNDHARNQAERLARLGYVALAADFHGDGKVYSGMADLAPEIMRLYKERDDWRARARVAFDALASQPQVDEKKIASIGYCFGGATSVELARSGAPLKAIVTFHAGIAEARPEDAGNLQASALICHGADDTVVKKETVEAAIEEFERENIDWQVNYYGNAAHSFTNPDADAYQKPGFGYSEQADRRSWAAMSQFFDDVLR